MCKDRQSHKHVYAAFLDSATPKTYVNKWSCSEKIHANILITVRTGIYVDHNCQESFKPDFRLTKKLNFSSTPFELANYFIIDCQGFIYLPFVSNFITVSHSLKKLKIRGRMRSLFHTPFKSTFFNQLSVNPRYLFIYFFHNLWSEEHENIIIKFETSIPIPPRSWNTYSNTFEFMLISLINVLISMHLSSYI